MKSLKKEDIQDLSFKDITYLILEKEKKSMNTLELFTEIVKLLELSNDIIDKKIGDYYTALTTDKRFLLVDGMWDLRTRHTSDKLLSSVDEEDEEDVFDNEENYDDEDEEEVNFDEDVVDDETPYDDEEDDDLADLVIVDDDMDIENN